MSNKTPGSGRKKGSLNKSTTELMEIAEKVGVNPFEILLKFANGNHIDLGYTDRLPPEVRMKAAAEAAKYLYAQRRALEVKDDTPIKVIVEDYTTPAVKNGA